MNHQEIERQLRELKALRRQGLITPEEAYRRHEDLVVDSSSVRELQPASVPAISEDNEPILKIEPRWLMAGLALVVLLVATTGAVYAGLRVAGVFESKAAASTDNRTVPPTIQPAVGPLPSATPGQGCYDGASARDRLEIVTADPPVSGPGPVDSIRVIVRYTLDSHDRARIVLQANSGTGARAIGPSITANRGTGVVTLVQTGQLPAGATYSVYMHPPEEVYRGYPCWRPLYVLPLNYSR